MQVSKIQTSGGVNIQMARNLRPDAAKLLRLIDKCIKEKRVLDQQILQGFWLEEIIKPKKRIVDGKYLGVGANGWATFERVNEYDKFKGLIKDNGLLDYWYLGRAKQWFKSNIGSLVMRGYLTVIPSINLGEDDPLLPNSEIEQS